MTQDPTDSLPHGEAARLVFETVSREGDDATCRARVPRTSPFRDGPVVSSVLAIEMGAQAAVSLERVDGGSGPDNGPGLIASISAVRLHLGTLPADAEFLVRVRREAVAASLLLVRFEVELGGVRVAEGSVGLTSSA